VQRAGALGKFRVLRSCRVGTSMRRIEKEGLVRLAFKYLYCEMYVVTGRPIREVPFDYEFAAFESAERPGAREALDLLRERLGGLADSAIGASSDGLRSLLRLSSRDASVPVVDQALRDLGESDVRRLQRYVGARVALVRRLPAAAASVLASLARSMRDARSEDERPL
jgi:hypothetical protein